MYELAERLRHGAIRERRILAQGRSTQGGDAGARALHELGR